MDPNSQNPTPAPAAPPADPAPAPKTIDPVDHSKPADTPPADPAAPPADPNAPQDPPADPNAPADNTPQDPNVDDIVGDATPDEMEQAIKARQDAGEELPQGINPDGTIDPLVYAYENMPLIKVTGKEGIKGELKTYEVKTAEDLPDDFRFANAKEQAKFSAALQQNMNVARDYMKEAQDYNQNRMAQNEQRTILAAQKSEIEALQESGRLPKFTLKPTDQGFMETAEAQRVQAVLSYMKELNDGYASKGINQRINSVEVGLQLLEAKEAIEARDARMGTIKDTRNDINGKISNGNNTGTPPAGQANGQRVHRNVNEALRFAKKQHGI